MFNTMEREQPNTIRVLIILREMLQAMLSY